MLGGLNVKFGSQLGTLEVGEEIDVFEERVNVTGTTRVRFTLRGAPRTEAEAKESPGASEPDVDAWPAPTRLPGAK